MAIVTATVWQNWANQTFTGTRLSSLAAICGQVDAAIKARLKRTIEQATYTNWVFDAPSTNVFSLARYAPILVSGFTLSYNANAQGDPTAFTSGDVLTMYRDYLLKVGPDTQASSSNGQVINLKGAWGVQGWRPNYSIAYQTVGIPGSLMATFTGGYANVPQDLVEAACLAVSRVLGEKDYGTQVGSESWNGYSYNLPGVGLLVNGILGSANVRGLLEPYVAYSEIFG